MNTILLVCGVISCLWIAWEDFKSREIYIYPFLMFILSGVGFRFSSEGWDVFSAIGINLAILGFLFCSILLIYRMKGEKKIMDSKIGWGDWVFLLGLALWLDPAAFILFYAISTIMITAFFLLARWAKKVPDTYPIPLAGLLGVGFVLFFPSFHYGLLTGMI